MATLTKHADSEAAAAADQCLVVAAHRGEMARPLHHPEVLADWLRVHWDQLVPATRWILVRDTIMGLHLGQYAARPVWLEFARWAGSALPKTSGTFSGGSSTRRG